MNSFYQHLQLASTGQAWRKTEVMQIALNDKFEQVEEYAGAAHVFAMVLDCSGLLWLTRLPEGLSESPVLLRRAGYHGLLHEPLEVRVRRSLLVTNYLGVVNGRLYEAIEPKRALTMTGRARAGVGYYMDIGCRIAD